MTEHCGRCRSPLALKCPCGRAECGLTTPVPFCPRCEKVKLDKWQTAHAIKVCVVYVDRQIGIGLPRRT